MTTTIPTTTPDGEPTVDSDRLMAFVFRAVGEIGATLNTALVVMGDRLGYYRALAGAGPTTPAELAERPPPTRITPVSGSTPRPPAASSTTTPHRRLHAARRARRRARRRVQPSVPTGVLPARPRRRQRRRRHHPRRPHRRRPGLARAQHRRTPGLRAVLPIRLRRPPGGRMAARTRRGHREADRRRRRRRRRLWPRRLHDPHGTGLPRSRFVGSDYHRESIDIARTRAADAGVADRVRFEVADASTYTGRDYDLVTMFDALHDMGDPVGAARHVHDTLTADGTWMIVDRRPGTGSRTTSTRSAASTTASPHSSAPPRRSHSPSGWRWAPRPAPPGSAR